jgi:hypothetical protein
MRKRDQEMRNSPTIVECRLLSVTHVDYQRALLTIFTRSFFRAELTLIIPAHFHT